MEKKSLSEFNSLTDLANYGSVTRPVYVVSMEDKENKTGKTQVMVQVKDGVDTNTVAIFDSTVKELQEKYVNSDIRRAVIEIANNNLIWKGSSGAVKNDAILYGIGLEDSTRDIGGFLHRYQGHFKNQDGVSVEIVKNGSGASYYKISKSTVDTVDEKRALTVDGFQNTDEMGISEVPFS